MSKDLSQGVVVLRALSSQIAFWALAVVAGFFIVDAVLRGRLDVAARTTGVALLMVWACWVFLVRMSVRLDASALTARNLLRWVRVPWARVTDIERRAQLVVLVDDGTAVSCWGSPFAPRAGVRSAHGRAGGSAEAITRVLPAGGRPPNEAARRSGPAVDSALEIVRTAWLGHPAAAGEITRGWDLPALMIGAVCLIAAVVAVVA